VVPHRVRRHDSRHRLDRHRELELTSLRNSAIPVFSQRWIGTLCAIVGVLGFSFKAILIKLAYRDANVDAITLLTLRMLYSAPLFLTMAAWAHRAPGASPRRSPIPRADRMRLIWLGCIGYYLASLYDFMGLQYITASLERLVLFLYPTLVVLLSALLLGQPVTRRAVAALVLSYAGIALVFWHDLRFAGNAGATLTGGGLVFASAILYALYLVQAGGVIARLGSARFIAWAMLASTVFVVAQFLLTRPVAALAVPGRIHVLSIAMAVFSTVLPTWLIAESIRRMGANAASLVGSLGPVFTIGLGAMILGEPIHAIQLAGAALVLGGVMMVTVKPRAAAR
jgi:drug/metabolite transporter (DMT)-like permease